MRSLRAMDLRQFEEPVNMPEMQTEYPGLNGPVGRPQIEKALQTYKEYATGRDPFTQRVVNAEEWWRQNHWERFSQGANRTNDPKSTSAWLFNSLINKHADYMDNYPMPAILPREKSDEATAKLLSDVVPVILEQNGFAKTYNMCCWDKPKTGTAVYGVFWDKSKENGLGDITISHIDLLNIMWEPGVPDLQDSRNLFTTKIVAIDVLKEMYPFLQEETISGTAEHPRYVYEDQLDVNDKVTVYDWYYKKIIHTRSGGSKKVLHYCKFIEGHLLYASENDVKLAADGWYEHGKYPFVFDVLFPEKGSPAGFGYLDVMVNPQEYIDRLDAVILKAALLNRARYFADSSLNMNIEELADVSKDIVSVTGRVDDGKLHQITPPQINDVVFNQRDAKVNELKETSGNRDFSQGSTTSGVTAASAIAALQEAGSKLSRDMLKGTYTAYEEVVTLVIELIRQFYDLPRCYRITDANGAERYVEFTNEGMKPQQSSLIAGQSELAVRKPVFDIKVSAQKASAYSRLATNELAKELFNMGVFNPQIADQAKAVVTMMDFDRKDEVLQTIERNGTMYQQMMQMQATMQQMAALIAKTTGDTSILAALGASGMAAGPAMTDINMTGESVKTDSLGRAVNVDKSQAGRARQRAAESTEVRA